MLAARAARGDDPRVVPRPARKRPMLPTSRSARAAVFLFGLTFAAAVLAGCGPEIETGMEVEQPEEEFEYPADY